MPITAQQIAEALNNKPTRGFRDSYMAICPCHDDDSPSLRITQRPDKILLYCCAGCTNQEVIQELKSRGLWTQATTEQRKKYQFLQRERLLFRDQVIMAMTEIEKMHQLNDKDRKRVQQAIRRLKNATVS